MSWVCIHSWNCISYNHNIYSQWIQVAFLYHVPHTLKWACRPGIYYKHARSYSCMLQYSCCCNCILCIHLITLPLYSIMHISKQCTQFCNNMPQHLLLTRYYWLQIKERVLPMLNHIIQLFCNTWLIWPTFRWMIRSLGLCSSIKCLTGRNYRCPIYSQSELGAKHHGTSWKW